jgi:hypothetical protein
MHGQDLVLSFIQPRYNLAYLWRYQENPFYKLDPMTGSERSKVISRIYNLQVSLDGGKVNLMQSSQWSWGNKIPSSLLLNDQWETSEDYSITLADLNNTHPRILARMEPLKHLADEFDLSTHVQTLNNTINTPELRKAFIQKYRGDIIRRCTPKNSGDRFTPAGFNSIPHTLGKILQKNQLTDSEEKFAARQLMCIWKVSERNAAIRSFRFPAGSYADKAVPCYDMVKNERLTIGHYRGTLLGFDLDRDGMRFCSWKQMPKLNRCTAYKNSIIDLFAFGKNLIVHSKGGIFIYDGPQLIKYMKNNILSSQGCFSVDTTSSDLELAVDDNPETFASLSHHERLVIGIDHGLKEEIDTVHITPVGPTLAMAGALIQLSDFSETQGFSTVGKLPDNFAHGKSTTVSIEPSQTARYWRVVTRSGGNVQIADLRFEKK